MPSSLFYGFLIPFVQYLPFVQIQGIMIPLLSNFKITMRCIKVYHDSELCSFGK